MKTNIAKIKGFYSKLTGVSLVVMAVISGLCYGFVLNQVYVAGNATVTLENIKANATLYALGNLGWIFVWVLDGLVAMGIYQIYKSKARDMAILVAGLRIMYCVLFFVGILALIHNDVASFMGWWQVALFIFGGHLIGLSALNFHKSSKNMPYVLACLLLMAGVAYGLINGIRIFWPIYGAFAKTLENIMVLPMALAELLLALWFFFKGEV